MISLIVLALFFAAFVTVCTVLVVSAVMLSGRCGQAEEEYAKSLHEHG